jgi:lysozyme family protein
MNSLINSYQESPYFVQDFINHTISLEGDYVNDEDDRGGETRFGITYHTAQKYLPYKEDYSWDGDMKTLPITLAQDIYAYEYYSCPKIYLIAEKSEILAKEVFDSAVNMGATTPIKFFQRLLNVFNNKQSYYNDIVVDGYLGQETISAYNKLCARRGEVSVENVFYNALNAMQCVKYIDIAEGDHSQESFVWGWIANRVDYVPF